jgi:hypothetical protein
MGGLGLKPGDIYSFFAVFLALKSVAIPQLKIFLLSNYL